MDSSHVGGVRSICKFHRLSKNVGRPNLYLRNLQSLLNFLRKGEKNSQHLNDTKKIIALAKMEA